MARRFGLVLAAAALAATVACGQSAKPAAPPEWQSYAADVTGVRPGPAPNVALIDLTLPAGADGCSRNPAAAVFDQENGHLYVNASFESARAQIVGGCPDNTPATVPLTVPDPLGTRVLVVNEQAWAPTGGAYRRCAPDVGCDPPADHCDPSWELAAFNGLDVPRHAYRSFDHCDQQWLVMTVDLNGGACGAGGRPGCSAPPSVTRYFLRFVAGWQVLAQTRSGGCAAVLAAEPTFPTALCEHLTAPG